ncbi:MAG: germination protein YpeB [Bacillota bacterium]
MDWKKHKNKIGLAALAVVLAGALIWAGISTSQAQSLERQMNNGYDRGYDDLLANLENLETSLSKLEVTSTSRQYTLELMDIWRQSGETKAILNTLPVSQVIMGDVSAFVTRMGDFCYMLGQKVTSGTPVTEDDLKQISQLHDTCVKVYQVLREEYDQNRGKLVQLSTAGYVQMPDEGQMALEKLSKDNTEYPHLIYDGPYSESRDELSPKSLKDEKTVDEAAAQNVAETFIGKDLKGNLERAEELRGTIECYGFKGAIQGAEGDVYIYVTKKGGKVLTFTLESPAAETVVPDEKELLALEKTGAEYLDARGYGEMKPTYSQYYNGQAVINYAAMQDGVLLYPDLIKVSIKMSDKRVVGIDARNYIMAHQKRTLSAVNLSADEAQAIINPALEITGERLTLIPKDDMTEELCYEFSIRKDGSDYLVYIDAVNGEEAEILKIIHTNEGSLVM